MAANEGRRDDWTHKSLSSLTMAGLAFCCGLAVDFPPCVVPPLCWRSRWCACWRWHSRRLACRRCASASSRRRRWARAPWRWTCADACDSSPSSTNAPPPRRDRASTTNGQQHSHNTHTHTREKGEGDTAENNMPSFWLERATFGSFIPLTWLFLFVHLLLLRWDSGSFSSLSPPALSFACVSLLRFPPQDQERHWRRRDGVGWSVQSDD